MKRISFLIVTLALCAVPAARAQDAATEERLNKLSGRIEDLIAGQEALKKQIAELAKEIEGVREQAAKPNAGYVSQEDLKRLAEAVKDVDKRRMDDAKKIETDLVRLRKTLEAPLAQSKKTAPATAADATNPDKTGADEKVFPYVIQRGDTLEAIVQAYKEKNIKVSVDQIVKANPGLKPEKLRVGQKIFIPAPQS